MALKSQTRLPPSGCTVSGTESVTGEPQMMQDTVEGSGSHSASSLPTTVFSPASSLPVMAPTGSTAVRSLVVSTHTVARHDIRTVTGGPVGTAHGEQAVGLGQEMCLFLARARVVLNDHGHRHFGIGLSLHQVAGIVDRDSQRRLRHNGRQMHGRSFCSTFSRHALGTHEDAFSTRARRSVVATGIGRSRIALGPRQAKRCWIPGEVSVGTAHTFLSAAVPHEMGDG